MKQQYHAIPVLLYVPVVEDREAVFLYDNIRDAIDEAIPGTQVFFAEDYRDGLVEIDPNTEEFSGMISVDCNRTTHWVRLANNKN